jgi:hypothetical protein
MRQDHLLAQFLRREVERGGTKGEMRLHTDEAHKSTYLTQMAVGIRGNMTRTGIQNPVSHSHMLG